MHRELSENRYWGMVVGEFDGGEFFDFFFCFVSNEFDYTHRSTGLCLPQTD